MRRPLHVLAPAALGLTVGLALGFGLSPRYRSTVSLGVELTPAAEGLSPSVAAEMLRRRLPAIRQSLSDDEGVAGARGALTVRAVGADRVELECVDADPARATAVANRLAARLVERAEAQRPKALRAGSEVSEAQVAQVAQARRELEATEEAMNRQRQLGVASSADPAADAAALGRLEEESAAVTRQLREAQGRLDGLRPAPQDPAVPPSDPELVRLRQELAVLRTRYTDQHPDVQAVRRLIAEREAIAVTAPTRLPTAEPNAPLRRAESEVESLSARQARLKSEMTRLRAPAGGVRTAAYDERRAALERERAQQQETYLALLRKQTEDRLAATRAHQTPAELFRVVNPASPPERPFFPNPWLFASVGFLAGMTVGVGAALLAEARDRTVKDAEDLRELLPQSVLAQIPLVRVPRSSRRG
jgi:uncharacterized protein involved in exopolysaccharide biosynthesis